MSRTRDLVLNILQWQGNLLASFFWLFQRPDAEWWNVCAGTLAQVCGMRRYANVCAGNLVVVAFLAVWVEPDQEPELYSPKQQRPTAWITAQCYQCPLLRAKV